jgi:uncharacterized membrane protein YagU involved in acid resistance
MRHASTIVAAGLVSGALDILAALASYTAQGATVPGILKYIASGLLGPAAMQGGVEIAWLGLLCHFLLTTAMAAIYWVAALKLRLLATQPWLWGSVYGVLTWLAMVFVVVPLSGVIGWKLPQGWSIVAGLLAHISYVGVPIAHIVRYGLRDSHRRA